MTREHVLMILGVLVLLAPWSGLPMSILEWVLVVIGLAIVGLAATFRRRSLFSTPLSVASQTPSVEPRSEPQPRSSHITFS